jgi:uncharacterized protein (DUF4415 family)
MSERPLTDRDGEVRELTVEDMKRFRPAAEVLPAELMAVLPKRRPGQRGPAKRPTKESVTIRFDPDVIQRFKSKGPGWQSRLNDFLVESLSPNGTPVLAIQILAKLNGRGLPSAWMESEWDRFSKRFKAMQVHPESDPHFDKEETATLDRYCDEAGMMTLQELQSMRIAG